MALIIDQRRRWEKASDISGERATVPPSSDHTDGTWSDTDIYEREIFLNVADNRLFTRIGNEIIEINSENEVVSGMAVSNGSDAVSFDVASGDHYCLGRLNSFPGQSDAAVINDGDASDPRFDLIYIDKDNNVGVEEGIPSQEPDVPEIGHDKTLLAAVYVPSGHTASGDDLEVHGPEIFFETSSRVIREWGQGKFFRRGEYVNESDVLYRVVNSYIASSGVSTDVANGDLSQITGSSSLSKYTESFDLRTSLSVVEVDGTADEIIVAGDITEYLRDGQEVELSGVSGALDGVYNISSFSFTGTNTVIVTDQDLDDSNPTSGNAIFAYKEVVHNMSTSNVVSRVHDGDGLGVSFEVDSSATDRVVVIGAVLDTGYMITLFG